jgi:hypothetical protein
MKNTRMLHCGHCSKKDLFRFKMQVVGELTNGQLRIFQDCCDRPRIEDVANLTTKDKAATCRDMQDSI